MTQQSPDMSKVAGGWLVPASEVPVILGCKAPSATFSLPSHARLVRHFMDTRSADAIISMAKLAPSLAPVSIQGLTEVTEATTGSRRTTMWSPELADELHRLFRHAAFSKSLLCEDTYPTDWWQHGTKRSWKWVGVSPMLRFMRYAKGGQHFCHYDAGFIYPDPSYRTLMSFVLYLSTNSSGATRIIEDNQQSLPVWERNHGDWSRPVQDSEVLAESLPVKGSVLIFPHRVPHDVQPYDGAEGDRIIIRGDLIYHAS